MTIKSQNTSAILALGLLTAVTLLSSVGCASRHEQFANLTEELCVKELPSGDWHSVPMKNCDEQGK